MSVWKSLVAWLAAMSADPNSIEQERPRAAAAVAIAMASMKPDEPTPVSESECECEECKPPMGVLKP